MESEWIKVLAIDDNQDNLIILKALIKEAFPYATTLTALTGAKGIELAMANDPDVILLDVVMPGMDGFKVCRILKADRSLSDIPVVFVTAIKGDKEQRIRALESGAEAFLAKPIDETELIAQIRAMVKIKKANLDKRDEKERLRKLVSMRTIELEKELNDRKKIESALRESEEKYRTMLNASPDGIVLIDLKGWVREVSVIGIELFGANKRDDLVGKHVFDFADSNDKNQMIQIAKHTIAEGLAQNIELKLKKIDQSLFLSEISSTLIQKSNGTPLSFMIVLRDISQRNKIQAMQIHADRMANLGQMAAGMAHEINQPLNTISMVMDKILFEADKTNTIDIQYLKNKSNKIFENITRMRDIIDHIRVFSRTNVDYIPTNFNVNATIEKAVTMIKEQFKHLDIQLIFDFQEQIPPLLGNSHQFEQVIINLLVNAKDALIEKKGIRDDFNNMEIKIKTYLDKKLLIVTVADNGTGITKKDLNSIMLPFYSTKEEGKGTGLGLSICYQIVQNMGGTIEIASTRLSHTIIKLIFDLNNVK
ncbi:MAG: response regulator [Paludibacter sp.]|nr:response regulator [Paludibacter sp.]